MVQDFTLYAVPLYVGLMLLSGIIAVAWQRWNLAVARYLILTCLLMFIYAGGYAMELGARTVDAARFWLKVEYLAIPYTGPVLLILALSYTGKGRYLRLRNIIMLLLVPVATTLLAWTNDSHELIWRNITIDRSHGFTGTLFSRGVWYWTYLSYLYLLFGATILLLINTFRNTSGIYKRQIGIFLFGMSVPMIANFAFVGNLAPPGLDLTPYAFVITALASGLGIFYYQLFDTLPIAQEIVVASLHDAVIVVDPRHLIIDANPAATALIGTQRRELLGRSIHEALPDALHAIATFALSNTSQAELTLPDQRSFDARSQPIHRHPARTEGHVILLRDITARRHAEQEHLRLIAELDAFAQTVAHDLKTPLTVIGSYSMALQEELSKMTPTDIEVYVDTITQYAHKMTNIIDEILLLTTLRKMDMVKLSPLDMTHIVTEAQKRLLTLIANAGAQIILPNAWPVAYGYASWIEEIWANYISNAIKYGGNPPRVELGGTAQPDGSVRFWVKDNGAGLTQEQQQQIFTPFTRLHELRAEGHGLGLSIVDRIVQKLGGTAGVESEPGNGSTFYFTLPAPPSNASS